MIKIETNSKVLLAIIPFLKSIFKSKPKPSHNISLISKVSNALRIGDAIFLIIRFFILLFLSGYIFDLFSATGTLVPYYIYLTLIIGMIVADVFSISMFVWDEIIKVEASKKFVHNFYHYDHDYFKLSFEDVKSAIKFEFTNNTQIYNKYFSDFKGSPYTAFDKFCAYKTRYYFSLIENQFKSHKNGELRKIQYSFAYFLLNSMKAHTLNKGYKWRDFDVNNDSHWRGFIYVGPIKEESEKAKYNNKPTPKKEERGISWARKVLLVNENTSQEEVTLAWKKLVKIWHPDINKTSIATSKFLEIQEAYKILKA